MRSWRRLSCTSISDHAESQRTRNWTRLLYIPIRTNAMTTRTPKTIQAMNAFLSSQSWNQGDGTTEANWAQLKLYLDNDCFCEVCGLSQRLCDLRLSSSQGKRNVLKRRVSERSRRAAWRKPKIAKTWKDSHPLIYRRRIRIL